MFTVIYHPEAEEEVLEAARFYNRRVPGLGADFLQELNQGVTWMLEHPARWRKFEADFRRYAVKRFPYAIIYRIESDSIRVLAIAHLSRHPDYWKHRKWT